MSEKLIARNRKARYEYHLEDIFDAGLVLKGSEVKALRQGKASINEAYCTVEGGEVWLKDAHIGHYDKSSRFNLPEKRPRKLLLNSREIKKLIGAVSRKGYTITPLRLYFNERGYAKLEIALARGKKVYDKREDIKRRDIERETRREYKIR